MANYTKATNFTAKDSLPSGNAGKIIKGAEIDTEFTAIASAISSKADLNSPALTGTPTGPTAALNTNTTQLATTAFVQAAGAALIPTGIITMWSGSIATIPTGWALCNGSNGTPDLRNRFIVGAHSDAGGVANTTITGTSSLTGGSKDAIVVSHTHTYSGTHTTGTESAGHTHSGTTGTESADHSHSVSGTTSGQSADHSHFVRGNGGGAGQPIGLQGNTNGGDLGGQQSNGTSNDHTHTFSATTSGISANHTHSFTTGGTSANHTHSVTVSGTTASTGSSGTNANLPPYYALAFIMKT